MCTCRRWDRVTAKLIAGIHASGLLDDTELGELADAFLAGDHVISYPLVWASRQWLAIDLHDGTGRTYTVTEDTPAAHYLRPEPPLRRWAARHALHTRPQRLAELITTADQLEPRHRDAAIHGLLDAASVLDEPARRTLIDRALRAAHGSVRIAALERLCELDGPETARRLAAADPNAQVRKWRPATDQLAHPVRDVMGPPRSNPSPKLLDAMIEDATVDAYNDEEQVTGLFTMLEEHLALPFDTEVLGITVTVTKIDLTAANDIVAICRRDTHKQAIPILDLPLPGPAPDGAEWIDAYRRWRR